MPKIKDLDSLASPPPELKTLFKHYRKLQAHDIPQAVQIFDTRNLDAVSGAKVAKAVAPQEIDGARQCLGIDLNSKDQTTKLSGQSFNCYEFEDLPGIVVASYDVSLLTLQDCVYFQIWCLPVLNIC